VLRREGWFVFSITHPCFQLPAPPGSDPASAPALGCGTYFVEWFWRSDNPSGVRGQVGAYHRPLSSYLNTLSDAGFVLEQVVEPREPEEMTCRDPAGVALPKFLIARWRKRSRVDGK
jgi:hypothetical protein